jgi:hypothetical protein
MFIKDWDYNFSKEKGVLIRSDPTNAAISNPKITLHPTDNSLNVSVSIYGGSSTGSIVASAVAFSDGFTSVNAMSNGSATGAPAPTKRALSFPVDGPCTVSVWVSTSSTNRRLSISDGTTELAFYLSASPSPYKSIVTTNYTGGAGLIYVYTNNTMTIAKIAVTNSLGTGDFKADASANVYSNGNQVFVSNVKSNTAVAVYSLTGALVKTVETSSDTSFNLEAGVYVAKVKSAEGEKSVKLLIQ